MKPHSWRASRFAPKKNWTVDKPQGTCPLLPDKGIVVEHSPYLDITSILRNLAADSPIFISFTIPE